MIKELRIYVVLAAVLFGGSLTASAAYQPVEHRKLKPGEIAVDQPGNYAEEGKTYVLTKDITSPRSAIFLGKNVTLDLNGYTIAYAAGNYEHIPNHSFEEKLKGWDVSKAPGAEVVDMSMVHPMVGNKVCLLPNGDELISPYINLPESNRAYYAMVAVASEQSGVDICIDDIKGNPVECVFMWGTRKRPCLPELNRSPKLGGGVVFALLFDKPAGKYRIRVRASKGSAVIDEVDIRPAMDVGISVVDRTMPWAYYKCILDGDGCGFFDYSKREGDVTVPVDSIPQVTGSGKITIKNGVIRSGVKGIRSWAIDSSANDVEFVINNIKIEAQGINTNAIRIPFGTISNCRVELDIPFIIDRHRHDTGIRICNPQKPSKVYGCELIGGQGQLQVKGRDSEVYDNLFVNRQTVTNHYSVSCDGSYIKIYRNKFHPQIGSGVYIYRQRGNEIFENEFRIRAEPPINEYSKTDYSVNAIRISDYGASKGDPKGWCENNKVYGNKFHITGRTFEKANPAYKPMTYAIFMSVGGGQNYIYDNEIIIDQKSPPNSDSHGAYAFYIGGSDKGGVYYGNTLTSNVTPIWIGNMYGLGKNVTMYGNAFVKAKGAKDFAWVKLGYYRFPSENISFFSNSFPNSEFIVKIYDYATGYRSSYSFGWTLKIKTKPRAEVTVIDKNGKVVVSEPADAKGEYVTRLAQYRAQGQGEVTGKDGKRHVKTERIDVSNYIVRAAGKEIRVTMNQDREVQLAQ